MCGCGGTSTPMPGASSSGPMRSAKMNGPTIRRAWNGSNRSTSDVPTCRRRGAITRSMAMPHLARRPPGARRHHDRLPTGHRARLVSEPYIFPKGPMNLVRRPSSSSPPPAAPLRPPPTASRPSDSPPLVAPSVAATAGPAPSTTPLTVVPTTAAGAAPSTDPCRAHHRRRTDHGGHAHASGGRLPADRRARHGHHRDPGRAAAASSRWTCRSSTQPWRSRPDRRLHLYQDPDGDLPSYFGDALVTLAADAAYMATCSSQPRSHRRRANA